MEEELISFETAKLAKEKKFNIPCENFYIEYIDDDVADLFNYEEQRGSGYAELYINNQEFKYSAPTQSLLQKWLREVHNIFVSCSYNNISCDGTYYIWYGVMSKTCNMKENFKTWEEALEFGLQGALKLIK